jgi:hypothetical protein
MLSVTSDTVFVTGISSKPKRSRMSSESAVYPNATVYEPPAILKYPLA